VGVIATTASRLLRRTMTGRDPTEEHRASTPLELLFDLCFVVAVAQASLLLHHKLAEAHVHDGVQGYLMVFFAIWWAWMNFSWFASAYDTDDIPYRLLTFLQIGGVLVLATGISDAFTGDFTVITVGYVIMRVAMVAQWLRAAAGDAPRRRTAQRFALAIVTVQVGWLLRIALLPDSWGFALFFVLIALELASPLWAEHSGNPTTWHPSHIAERYGLFTIIVLGECILSAFIAIESSHTEHGASARLIALAIGGLVIVFGIWWTYFRLRAEEMLETQSNVAFIWGYTHYGVFASIAAIGAGIAVAAEALSAAENHDVAAETHFALSDTGTTLAVAIPVASTLLLLAALRTIARESKGATAVAGYVAAALVLAAGLAGDALGIATAVVVIGAVVAAKVALDLIVDGDQHMNATE
jgi:low temperature requirement protein LtrA